MYVGAEKSWEECMKEVLANICTIIILSNIIFFYGAECGWDSSDDFVHVGSVMILLSSGYDLVPVAVV